MVWVWQGSRVNSWLVGCLAGGWLMWCCCLVVETGSWCWFGAAALWWKLEADADMVLLHGGGNWKLMLIWCCCLVGETGSWCWFGVAAWWWKLRLICCWWWLPGCLGVVQGPLGCADSLILLIFTDFADFCCCCHVVGAESWCWFFNCPHEFDWKWWSDVMICLKIGQ